MATIPMQSYLVPILFYNNNKLLSMMTPSKSLSITLSFWKPTIKHDFPIICQPPSLFPRISQYCIPLHLLAHSVSSLKNCSSQYLFIWPRKLISSHLDGSPKRPVSCLLFMQYYVICGISYSPSALHVCTFLLPSDANQFSIVFSRKCW